MKSDARFTLDCFKPMLLGGRIKNKNGRTRRSDRGDAFRKPNEKQTSTQQVAIGVRSKQQVRHRCCGRRKKACSLFSLLLKQRTEWSLPALSELGTVTYLSVHGPCCFSRAPRDHFISFTSLQAFTEGHDSDSFRRLALYGVEVDSTACSTVYRQGSLCCNGDF